MVWVIIIFWSYDSTHLRLKTKKWLATLQSLRDTASRNRIKQMTALVLCACCLSLLSTLVHKFDWSPLRSYVLIYAPICSYMLLCDHCLSSLSISADSQIERQLYKFLVSAVDDILSQIPKHGHLIIVPDKCICQIPFHALRDFKGTLLCAKYSITYLSGIFALKLVSQVRHYITSA